MTLNPIDSSATVPVKTIRSAHEILRPYFCLIGQISLRALSRLTLSGRVLVKDLQVQLIGPPVMVRRAATGGMVERTLLFNRHVTTPLLGHRRA
jgi:hypothetical protein